MRRAPIIVFVVAIAAAGCSPTVVPVFIPSGPPDHGDHREERRLTASATTCSARDVVIREHDFGFARSTWFAQCGDRRYRCSVTLSTTCIASNEPLPVAVER